MLVGVDPGAKHCGVVWLRDDGSLVCWVVWEPTKVFQYIEYIKEGSSLKFAIEQWQLYKWAHHKTWDSVPEAENIGVMKYLLERKGIPYTMVQPSAHKMQMKEFPEEMKSPHARDAYSIAMWAHRFVKRPLRP
jgi:hypothetical protein